MECNNDNNKLFGPTLDNTIINKAMDITNTSSSSTESPTKTLVIKESKRRKRSDEKWMATFQRLVEYKRVHGHTRVPQRYKADPKLGTWVDNHRRKCKNPDHIKLLDSIGFEWKVREMKAWKGAWMVMYQRLVAFKEKHG